MTALLGTFVNVKTMADGTPRLVLDLQCTLAEIAALGLIPGTPFGIARISGEASVRRQGEKGVVAGLPADSSNKNKDSGATEKPGPLCVLACQWCKDQAFWRFLAEDGNPCSSEDQARQLILNSCQISSRKELDTNLRAADLFHACIREPFMCWKAE